MFYILGVFVFFLLTLEGFGLPFGREATLFLIIFIIPILFVHMLFRKRNIEFPKKVSILFIILIASTLISTFFSINIQKSIPYSLYLLSLFLVFLLSVNYRDALEKPLYILIFSLSLLFTIYYLLLDFHILNLYIPPTGYQFVFSKFGSHNHLGDFLVLPVVICIYYLYYRKHLILNTCYLILATSFIFFSYSRSAYISLALTVIFMLFYLQKHTFKNKWVIRIFAIIIVLITSFLIIAVTPQAQKQPLSSGVNKYLVQKEQLKNKDLLGRRPMYAYQTVLSFQKHPFIGIGPNNFVYLSQLYTKNPNQATETTHNIFLEILVGQGILSFAPFIALILLVLINSRKNALYFGIFTMFINFQTDYTYQIYSFLLLFFCITGTIYNENTRPNVKRA